MPLYIQCHLVDHVMTSCQRKAESCTSFSIPIKVDGLTRTGLQGDLVLVLWAFHAFIALTHASKLLSPSKVQVEKTMGGKGSSIYLQIHSASTLYLLQSLWLNLFTGFPMLTVLPSPVPLSCFWNPLFSAILLYPLNTLYSIACSSVAHPFVFTNYFLITVTIYVCSFGP